MERIKLIDAYLRFMRTDRSPNSQKSYESFLGRKFVPAIGPENFVDTITQAQIEDFIYVMRTTQVKYQGHPNHPEVEEPLSPATITRNFKMIRALFNYCVRQEWIVKSPVDNVYVRHYRRPPASSKAISAEDLQKLIDIALLNTSEFLRYRDKALMLFLADTGCRAGGAASLRMDTVNLEKREALIHEKGDHYMKVMFGSETAEAIRDYLEVRPETSHPYLFVVRGEHGPFNAETVGEVIKRLCERAGIRRWGPHAIRHRVGQAWADAGMSPTLVQSKLGHSSVLITLENYFNQDETRLREATDRLALASARSDAGTTTPSDPPAEEKIVSFAEERKRFKK